MTGMNLPTIAELASLLEGEGVSLPAGAEDKLLLHAAEMLRWNRSIRLTSITAPQEVAVKHILDSLLLLSFSPFPGRTLDFGSGAGYPGIPLAIALPEARLVLLESSAKKCAFLSHACAMLGLGNATVIHGRIDSRGGPSIGRFEQIVTRATLPPPEAAELLVPLLAPGGRLLLMAGPGKGRRGEVGAGESPAAEEALPPGTAYGRRERFTLPSRMGYREIREVRAKA